MKQASGFTLIELMVVVAIVGILAAIAVPAYTEQVRKSRRAEAVRFVGDMQLALERWRAENPSYANCSGTGCGSGTYPVAPTSTVSPFYTIAIATATTSAYSITATPAGAQSGDRCGVLTLASGVSNGKPQWATASCN
ncbi:type IV pilin protein [Lysobacter olei]